MTYKPDELKEMIPMYLNGRLSEPEKKEFESALNKYPELKHELIEFSEIMETYKDIEDEIPFPSDSLYANILSNIKSGREEETLSRKKGYIEQFREFLKDLFSSPRVSWTIVAVQLVIILVLVVFTLGDNRFKTLTSEYTVKGEGIKINVVFKEDAKEKEIRDLMSKVRARIISGPTPDGLYVLEIKNNREVEEIVIKNLISSEIVRFAEKAF